MDAHDCVPREKDVTPQAPCPGGGIVTCMALISAVYLRGGPCDGEGPEPLPGTTFPDDLDAITVMDNAAGVGHVTSSQAID